MPCCTCKRRPINLSFGVLNSSMEMEGEGAASATKGHSCVAQVDRGAERSAGYRPVIHVNFRLILATLCHKRVGYLVSLLYGSMVCSMATKLVVAGLFVSPVDCGERMAISFSLSFFILEGEKATSA